ncbi:glycoside hydrolase family 3 N-terminal domain-containing protein [Lacticaseibacillus jixiensis]|uniref:glycoside hydrolase family 3 N-terminal domain-containing protein n=1 Tax=Lacticaseibacillus jixiensis TaxID=3231926 RepID=UPI0036F24578
MKTAELTTLLKQMTVEEKIGQLVQVTPDFFSLSGEITGPMVDRQMSETELGAVGSVLGVRDGQLTKQIQERYLQVSRLKIPLMFMADVIHGYSTIYPIPLALAASFDPALVEEVARLSGAEAAENGVHVTFSPMCDHVRDPRWGRVMESSGEDAVLNKAMSAAYVRGYQGSGSLADDPARIAACVKHFAGYGGVLGGRDYNNVDVSPVTFKQDYLKGYQGAIDAGAKMVMTGFSALNGVPPTGNKPLMHDTLRQDMGFDGVVISDWAAIAELIQHRVAADKVDAAVMALDASVDIDMVTDCYQHYLQGALTPALRKQLDTSVMRILRLKNELGLFEDPYRGMHEVLPAVTKERRAAARRIAAKTLVLLKNSAQTLPLQPAQAVALIGPKAESQDILGNWAYCGEQADAISLATGLLAQHAETTVVGAKEDQPLDAAAIAAMVKAAAAADVAVVAVGEKAVEAGENRSKTNINLAADQVTLIKQVAAVNPHTVVVLFTGRPLILTEIIDDVQAVLLAWQPGTEGGNAIADVLCGVVNPSAKLSMSFPRSVGQIPISYSNFSTGRPLTPETESKPWVTRYIDSPSTPLFPFGYGLSYSDFTLQAASVVDNDDGTVTLPFTVDNSSAHAGTAVVQLYLEDMVTQVTRPLLEYKQSQRVPLAPGATYHGKFVVNEADLAYVHADLREYADSGKFRYLIGFDNLDGVRGEFDYLRQ